MSPAKKTTAKPKKGSSPTGEVDRAYFAAQSPDKRALLEKLRALVAKGAPGAVPAIKWGVAVYAVNGRNVCALAAFKDHVAINFFAPSGGGHWVIQGPFMIDAAKAIGASPAQTAMSVMLGNSWNDLVQPFWILPALALSKLKLKDIMGYTVIMMFWVGIIYISAILLWGFLG